MIEFTTGAAYFVYGTGANVDVKICLAVEKLQRGLQTLRLKAAEVEYKFEVAAVNDSHDVSIIFELQVLTITYILLDKWSDPFVAVIINITAGNNCNVVFSCCNKLIDELGGNKTIPTENQNFLS